MKKRLLSVLLSVCMVLAMLPGTTLTAAAAVGDAFTANITVGGAAVPCAFRVLTEDAGSSTGTVQIGDGTSAAIPTNTEGALIIPSSVSNKGITYTVTKIGNYAFKDCEELTSLAYDSVSGITSIGMYAFYACRGLTGLSIPDSVTSIGNYAFAYCVSASAINFSSEDTLTSIGEGAFYYCQGLTGELDIPSTVTSIGFNAFNSCSGFTGILTIPDSVTSIEDNAFAGCRGLTGLSIPDSVTSIGSYAFSGCSGFTGALTIPDSVTSIGSHAFNGCSGLTGALTIPNLVTSIGSYAFNGCNGFTGALTIPNSVTSIGSNAFNGCSGLTGPLTIPNSLTSIGDRAFNDCSGFTGELDIPDSVTSIGSYAFYNCSGLTGLRIPGSVTSIAGGAFWACSALAFVELQGTTLPATMGADVFKACYSFNKFIVPATWTGGNSVTLPGIDLPFTGSKLVKDAGLESVLGEALSTSAGGAGAVAGAPITWSIDVANDVTEVTSANIVPSTGSTAVLYANAGFTANEGESISLTEGGATTAYIKVTGGNVRGDGTITVRYHAVTIHRAGDDVAPSGYSISIDQTAINNANKDSLSFTFSGGEVDATYNYTVSSSGGAGSATGSGIMTSATQQITGIDVSGLPDGTLTLSVTLTDGADNQGDAVTDTISKDTAAPVAVGFSPANAAASVAVNADLVITFDEIVTTVTGKNIIIKKTSDDTIVENIDVGDAKVTGSGSLSITVNPDTTLANSTGYYIQIDAGAFKDAHDNPYAGMADTTTWAFTTAAPASGGGGSRTPTIVTKIDSGETVANISVDQLIKEGKALTVEGKTGEKLVFDTEALKSIDDQTKDSIKIEIKDVSADYKHDHPDRLVVSLTVTAGGRHITSFGNGTATVSLPYELKPGEKAADVTVWYLAEDGTMTEVPCTYDPVTKLATFKVSHFSLYVVGTADAAAWINPFGDVTESDWFYGSVEFANRKGLFAGTGADRFSPNTPMTRAMLWTVLGRLDGQELSGSGVFEAARSWAKGAGITDGTNPDKSITREQMVSILWRYAGSPGAVGDLSKFSDAGNVATYAEEAMAWAVENHIIAGAKGGLMPGDKATRAQVAAILQRYVESMGK